MKGVGLRAAAFSRQGDAAERSASRTRQPNWGTAATAVRQRRQSVDSLPQRLQVRRVLQRGGDGLAARLTQVVVTQAARTHTHTQSERCAETSAALTPD
eukprot:COSAG01_NODE_25869_length_730_cov_2.855784_1_plen_99_part_00